MFGFTEKEKKMMQLLYLFFHVKGNYTFQGVKLTVLMWLPLTPFINMNIPTASICLRCPTLCEGVSKGIISKAVSPVIMIKKLTSPSGIQTAEPENTSPIP